MLFVILLPNKAGGSQPVHCNILHCDALCHSLFVIFFFFFCNSPLNVLKLAGVSSCTATSCTGECTVVSCTALHCTALTFLDCSADKVAPLNCTRVPCALINGWFWLICSIFYENAALFFMFCKLCLDLFKSFSHLSLCSAKACTMLYCCVVHLRPVLLLSFVVSYHLLFLIICYLLLFVVSYYLLFGNCYFLFVISHLSCVICAFLCNALYIDALCDCWDLLFCPHIPVWQRRQCNYIVMHDIAPHITILNAEVQLIVCVQVFFHFHLSRWQAFFYFFFICKQININCMGYHCDLQCISFFWFGCFRGDSSPVMPKW